MKRTFCIIFIALIMLFSACSPNPITAASQSPAPTADPAETLAPSALPTASTTSNKSNVITLYCYSQEVMSIINKYIELHPDFRYTVEAPVGSMYEGIYQDALDQGLSGKRPDAPDIYFVESAIATRYTQGEMSGYAMPYKDLIPDFDAKIASAGIVPYIVDVGTRPGDNAVVGLAYQSTAGAFIYRRSIAKRVWGTDDPAVISSKIGPGWNKFFSAAEDLKRKGYSIVSGSGDMWYPVQGSADKSWVVDGKLYIDPKRASFMDYAKQLKDNGYSNNTDVWTDPWYADMAGTGDKKVLGFFGPSWLSAYVLADKCTGWDDNGNTYKLKAYGDYAVCEPPASFFWSGTWVLANKTLNSDPNKKAAVADMIDWINLQCGEDSLQYQWANGTLFGPGGTKDTVASETVMARSDGAVDFLGGQNIFDVFIPAGRSINGCRITEYDEAINKIWLEQVRRYVDGECTRDEALAVFKQQVKEQLQIDAM